MIAERRILVPLEIDATAPALGAVVHDLQGLTMGTRWSVRLSGPRLLKHEALQHEIQQQLDTVVAQMSPWEADSDISRFNRGPTGSWHELPAAFEQVIRCALRVASDSGGAFDPTAGELVDLWGFGPPGPVAASPSPQALAAARARMGWQHLSFEPEPRARLRQPGGLRLDLSAIAKGFGVDLVAQRLRHLGFENHLVEVGGELRGSGIRPDGQPWWVDLRLPPGSSPQAAPAATDSSAAGAAQAGRDGRGAVAAHVQGTLQGTRVALHGLSIATSGDYLRGFDDETGVWRSHSVDPRTGWPITNGLASVSVLHAQCMWADAWSTALTVLGPREGMAVAKAHQLPALFIERRGNAWHEHLSPALEAMAQ